jgi:hypothetical protein
MSERGPPSFFWDRLTGLATSNPNVLKLIVDNLNDDASNLRASTSVMRKAVNRTVSVVCYVLDTPHPHSDLVEVFPEADELICNLEGSIACAGPPIEHVCLLLDLLATSSPRFVRKLRALKMRVRESHISKFVGVMAEFLPRCVLGRATRALTRAHCTRPFCLFPRSSLRSDRTQIKHADYSTAFSRRVAPCRCTSLQALEVHAKAHHAFKFQGQGSTIAERRKSMQQQLAAMCSSSDFLAPASWPASRCLTTLTIDTQRTPFDQGLASAIVPAALQTLSLVDLDLKIGVAYPADDFSSFQHLSTLTALTHLRLLARSRGPEDQKLLLTAVARTASLRRLSVSCGGSRSDAIARLPLSQLARLTHLHLEGKGLRVDMHYLSGAPRLQHLSMTECTGVGCLTSLFPLTSLTSLEGPPMLDPSADDGGVAAAEAPAAWRQGLVSLRWPAAWYKDTPRVVPQLTALTQLNMTDVCVSPDFCR